MLLRLCIWTVLLVASDARLLRAGRDSLLVQGVADLAEALRLLERSPVSCVAFEASRQLARLSVGPDDVYDPEELLQRGLNSTTCRRRVDVLGRQEQIAMMVPTYPPHQDMYNRLVESVRRNVEGPALLISVFSSVQESAEMTEKCGAPCWAAVEGSSASSGAETRRRPSAQIRHRSMVFNHGWRQFGADRLRKVNYQAAKKIWALHHCQVEKVLMLDSDFSILRPIVLQEAIAPYEHVLYEMNLTDLRTGSAPLSNFWDLQFTLMDRLLGIRKPRMLHFEQPWIFHKEMVRELVTYLTNQSSGQGAIEHVLSLESLCLEILLYRRFVLHRSTDPKFFSRVVPTHTLWFEEPLDAREEDRLALTPPPIGVRHSLQQRAPCQICWLEAHADRD